MLSEDTQLEELIGRNVRLDYVDLTLASNDPIRYPLQQKWKSKSSQQSEEEELNQRGKLKKLLTRKILLTQPSSILH